MKKLLTILAIIIVLFMAGTYIFISSQLTVSKVVYASCNVNAANRLLANQNQWARWWPDSSVQPSASTRLYPYKDYQYAVNSILYNKIMVRILRNQDSLNSFISLFPGAADSVAIEWKCKISTSLNPFKRIQQYKHAVALKEQMSTILSSLQSFIAHPEKIYGFSIEQIISKDSTLIGNKFSSSAYPTVTTIYQVIHELKSYIASQGALEANYPMLNVRKINDTAFQTTIAIPTNKKLAGNGRFYFARFVPWRTLKGTVQGGNATVTHALEQLQLYTEDYRRNVMAASFQSLVTDRSQQPDTTKWVTIIYVPVS